MGRKPKIEKIHVYVSLIYFVYSRKEYSIAKELYSNKNSLKKRIFNVIIIIFSVVLIKKE